MVDVVIRVFLERTPVSEHPVPELHSDRATLPRSFSRPGMVNAAGIVERNVKIVDPLYRACDLLSRWQGNGRLPPATWRSEGYGVGPQESGLKLFGRILGADLCQIAGG